MVRYSTSTELTRLAAGTRRCPERFTAASRRSTRPPLSSRPNWPRRARWRVVLRPRGAHRDGMDPGPELESISGQKSAGTVTEDRRIQFEGREIEASPVPTNRT